MKNRGQKVNMAFPKDKYTKLMAENLPTLRTKLGINQDEMAELVGSSRQMLSLIERGVRPMMWDTFMSMHYIFRCNTATKDMMRFLGLYTDELEAFLQVSKSPEEGKIAAFGGVQETVTEADIKKYAAIKKALEELEK